MEIFAVHIVSEEPAGTEDRKSHRPPPLYFQTPTGTRVRYCVPMKSRRPTNDSCSAHATRLIPIERRSRGSSSANRMHSALTTGLASTAAVRALTLYFHEPTPKLNSSPPTSRMHALNTYLMVSNMVTSDSSVVTSRTILPGTTSGITTKLPHDIMTNNVLGK